MASRAYTEHLAAALADVDELLEAHQQLRPPGPGRVWKLGGLNRAAFVLTLGAWEGYVENVIVEVVDSMKTNPATPAWSSLATNVAGRTKAMNTPNTDKVDWLFEETLGIVSVSSSWYWKGMANGTATSRLNDYVRRRGACAHGVVPRPEVRNKAANIARDFIWRLAERTDNRVKTEILTLYGHTLSW